MKKNKVVIALIIILIVLAFIIIVYLNSKKIKSKDIELNVILSDNLKLEINTEIKILNLIKKIKNGKILIKNVNTDTSKLGKKKIIVPILYGTIIYNYDFNIEIVDTIPPVIESQKEININIGNNIDITKSIKVTDNSKENIKVEIEGNYDTNKQGNYNLVLLATDLSGNKTKKDLVLKVNSDPNNRVITTSKGYTLKVVNGVTYINGILIANKSYKLPSTYGSGITNDTINSYNSMKAAATTDGINIYIISGYRSYYDQQYLYNNYVSRDGKIAADRYSARPGHSEHQTGLAFDLNSVDFSFENTIEAKWINNNCYKYGFILRYPKGKESITGYMYEPWHLRYVGVDLAKKLYNNGNWITLEEYFGIDSKY